MINDFNEALRFEEKSNIFFIQNADGIYLWDIFRYFVWDKLRYELQSTSINLIKNHKVRNLLRIITSINEILKSFFFFCLNKSKYDTLYFFASRNQYEGTFIDQNQFDTYNLFQKQKKLILETCDRKKYKFYKEPIHYYGYIRYIFKIFYHPKLTESDYKTVNTIYELLKSDFGELNFTENDLYFLLENFYLDVHLWIKIIDNHNLEKIFLTQNGIQKGIFFAAKKRNIPVYEVQHGIISNAHPAYSYPRINGIEKCVHVPYKFLTLSDYWCKSFFCPIQNHTIGNNYFSKQVTKFNNPTKILVISANVFGKELALILKEGILSGVLNAADLIFKLHPNQYFEKDYYINFFEGKVTVLTNEKSVNELLGESKCMITVCSTAAYEALQANTRVLVYTISMYKEMELLFNDKNLFLFSNINELENGLRYELPADYKAPIFFEKCTPEKIKTAIDGN